MKVISNDGSENMSAEAWRAFNDKGTPIAGEGIDFVELAMVGDQLPDDSRLSPEQVRAMLAEPEWSLVIRLGKDNDEVLDRDELDAAARSDGSRPARLRELNEDEAVALAAAIESATGTLGRLRAAKALPITAIGGAVALVGAYGAAKANFAYPCLAKLAAGVGVISVLLAGALSYFWLGDNVVRLSRLDKVRVQYARLVDRGGFQSKLTVISSGLMVLLLALSVLLPAEETAPSLTIGAPSVSRHGSARTATLTVKGAHLSDSVTRLRTTVSQGGKLLVTDDSTTPSDGAVEDKVSTPVPSAGDIDVAVSALNATGHQVGAGQTQVFDVD